MPTANRTPVSWKGIDASRLFDAWVTRAGSLVEIPYFDEDGRLYSTRMVKPNGRRWWRPAGNR